MTVGNITQQLNKQGVEYAWWQMFHGYGGVWRVCHPASFYTQPLMFSTLQSHPVLMSGGRLGTALKMWVYTASSCETYSIKVDIVTGI